MLCKMPLLVVKRVSKLLWATGLGNDHDTCVLISIRVSQSRIKLARIKVILCCIIFLTTAAYPAKLIQDVICPIAGNCIKDTAMPVISRQIYILYYHGTSSYIISSQGIGIPLPSILATHMRKMFSGLSSTSSMIHLMCLARCASSSIDSFI